METFDFDEEVNRRAVPALKTHPMVLGQGGEHLFAAGVADMDFKAPPVVLQAMQQRLDHGVFGYEAVPEALFPALTDWLKTRHGWQVDTQHILRAPNVLNSLAIAVSLFSGPGEGVIVQPPVFFDFYDILRENDREIVRNPLVLQDGRYEMDFAGLERLAADPANRILLLCNPHNPVGRVWSPQELRRMGQICARHDVLVVSDEIHGDITFSGHRYTPFAALGEEFAGNAITCISPAKSFNIASCCSAFTIVSNAERRQTFQAENSRLTVNKNNAFASVAMLAAYARGGPWLDAVLTCLEKNLALVRRYIAPLAEVELIEPEGTFLVWLDFRKTGLTPDDLIAFLRRKAGWAVTRGQAFGPEGEGFVRLNIACRHAVLEQALQRLVQNVSHAKHFSAKGLKSQ